MKVKKPRANAKDKSPGGARSPPPNQMEVDQDSDSDQEEFPVQEGGINIPTREGNIYIPPAPPATCSLDSKGPRLIITHIENENFKSYAGRRVLGPFHKSFTCIVGPNGSGKSNVIDSMLFVFGYRATKIRSKKISTMLHKSENHTNVQSYTVTVHFAKIIDIDDDNFEFVPNSKFYISRTAFADNSSFYTINGKRTNFKQVSTLLLDQGIDLIHNRFLILQGEVEQIAMMKPKAQTEHDTGMLEYLEDIIGTSRFKTPIEKLAAEVEVLNGERVEKLNRVKLVEKERDALEGPMTEAIEFLETTNELMRLRNELFQSQQYGYRMEVEKNEKEKKEKEDGMSELKAKMKELGSKQEELQKEIKKKEKEYDGILSEKEKNNTRYNQMNTQNAAFAEELKQVNNKRKKVKDQLKTEEEKLTAAEAIPEKNQKEIEDLKKVLEKCNSQRTKEQEEVSRVLASLQEETRELQDQKDKLQAELSGLKQTVDQARSKHDLAESEMKIYLSNEQKEKSKLEQFKATLDKVVDKLKDRKAAVAELEVKLPKAREDLSQAQAELAQVREQEAIASQEWDRRRTTLEERRVAMNANRSRNRVLDFLLTQKREGAIPGIFGRLGDLGAIDDKYDIAISTACGALDFIVVDTVATGEACVAALKRHNVGRGTFIALEKQEYLRNTYSRPFNTPDGALRLFDLIKVADDRIRPAFYYAIRDTLVANDLDQATRIAYGRQRHRVVTLKGELIELHGTMSGGGGAPARGRMGQSVAMTVDMSPSEMGRMEQAVTDLEKRVRQLRNRTSQLEGTIETLTRDVKLWSTDLNKFKVEVDGLSSQEPVLRQQVKAQEARVKEVAPDQSTVKKMKSTVEAAKKELDKAEGSAGKVEEKVKTVHEEILKITGGRTNAAQKKLNEVIKKADKISSEITKLGVAIKTAERNTKKSKEAIKNMEADIEQMQDRLIKIKEDKDKITEEAKEVLAALEDLSKKEIELEQVLTDLKAEIADIVKEENTLKASRLEEDRVIKNLTATINDFKAKIAHKDRELGKLELRKIPKKEVDLELPKYGDEHLSEIDIRKLEYKTTTVQAHLEKQKPNLKVIDDYYEKLQQLEQRTRELEEVTEKRNEVRTWHDNVRKSRLNEFMAGFTIITDKLKEMYQMITLGGDAELELVDSLDPFTEGIVFSVRPPKKSWKNISNLSGGEKTLSSLALVFALHYYKPTPLYVMDEIDAALDFKNVSIVGHYIKERTKNAQFIIISLRANMFELADTLVGIFKVHNCTDSVTILPPVYSGSTKPVRDHSTALKEPNFSHSPPRKIAKRTPLEENRDK
ncbi:structural maintenance of chromosomes protein 4 isoform X2 [Macrosteles quadrilineatus]|uniref:structural maintenance of chromosomes protein 4 isoform X2 n=1 Tax=Macrosteles quadrilineatus TaxID=74068 RepID=UPI0023E16DF8|nr:structural maintenance of chromosomes protein 4 isoform X2 [Macrosteles quadrilineatus]